MNVRAASAAHFVIREPLDSQARPGGAKNAVNGGDEQSALSCSSNVDFTDEVTFWIVWFSCQINFAPTILKAIMKVPPSPKPCRHTGKILTGLKHWRYFHLSRVPSRLECGACVDFLGKEGCVRFSLVEIQVPRF
jgi:hypothetical protein